MDGIRPEPEASCEDKTVVFIRSELANASSSTRRKLFEKFILAALGSIPWVGGFLSAVASLKTEQGDIRTNNLQTQWLEEHEKKMERLKVTLNAVAQSFERLGERIDERIQSEGYLDLVRRSFRAWDRADTEEKRSYVANLISNASGTRLCSDDVVRLFIDWLDKYHEAHLAVIREIYKNPGATRLNIWEAIHGELVREDSADADLFKVLVRDLGTGGVIRQARETTGDGEFLRKQRPTRRGDAPTTMESAFEDTKPYVLTELGKQFVHYTMNEVVSRITAQ
ncbi:MAG: hypothetical protein AAB433_23015 [Nitrospirota bacterium]